MKTKLLSSLVIIFSISLVFFACTKMEDEITSQTVSLSLPQTPFDYNTFTHDGFHQTLNLDNNLATLGRVLFYDTHLSVNNSISCGSCHKQSLAFSDNIKFSAGFENHSTLRNTLPIQNLSNSVINSFTGPSLFWDGRADFLPSMVLMPITNHVEMGMSDVNAIADKVIALPYYKDLFMNTFNSTEVTPDKIGYALNAFVSSIASGNTKFDLYNNNRVTLTAIEEEGRNLFFNKYNCNSCHQTQQLNGYQTGGGFVNIGLDAVYTDKGHENVSHNPVDNGAFKIPNLRNIALTAPYMHDGRFATLSDVIDHYSQGIANTPALDQRLKDTNGQAKKMNISAHEKDALIAFLNTLTDYTMITDVKYSNPFRVK